MLALFLVSLSRPVGDAGDLAALRYVEEWIEAELARLDKMEKSSDGIRRHNEDLAGELREARNQFALLLRKAKNTLKALNVEMLDEASESGVPLVLPGGDTVGAKLQQRPWGIQKTPPAGPPASLRPCSSTALPRLGYSNRLISVTPASASLAQGSQEAGYGQEAAGRDLCPCLDGQADNNEPAA